MAHGSRIPEANDAVYEIAAMVKEMTGYEIVEVSFREQHQPNIQKGIDACVAKGAERILLVPYFLFIGAHVQEDLPEELAEAQETLSRTCSLPWGSTSGRTGNWRRSWLSGSAMD